MPKRQLKGKVVSKSGIKTVAVQVERLVKHPMYKKYVRRHAKFIAHDESDSLKAGDEVTIVESPPISKHKKWRVEK